MFCPQCGTNVQEGFNFCCNCGFNMTALQDNAKVKKKAEYAGQANALSNKENDNSACEEDLPPEIAAFDGSQEEYERLYNKYLYEEKDFRKLALLDEFDNENYPQNQYRLDFWVGVPAQIPEMCQLLNEEGFDAILASGGYGEVKNYVDAAGTRVAIAYFNSVFWKRRYSSMQALYDWFQDWEKINKLAEAKANTADSNEQASLDRRMKVIMDKYPEGMSSEYFVPRFLKLVDLRHLQADLTVCVGQYSGWVDQVYTLVLDNAVRMHGAAGLQNMYPTAEQKSRFRKIVEEKIYGYIRPVASKLPILGAKADECARLAEQIIELNKKTSDKEVWKQGLITAALSFLSGPYGIANGIRTGYEMYNADSKAAELKDKLSDALFNEFYPDYNELAKVFSDAVSEIWTCMQEEIGANYLCPALNNIFSVLASQNVRLAPLPEYFRK